MDTPTTESQCLHLLVKLEMSVHPSLFSRMKAVSDSIYDLVVVLFLFVDSEAKKQLLLDVNLS